MRKFIRKFLILAIVFSIFLFVVCETQIASSTGIIDKDRLLTFRLKNGSTGVISFFGYKAYISTDEAEMLRDAAKGIYEFESGFIPTLLEVAVSKSALSYHSVFEKMTSLFSENSIYSEPENAKVF